MDTSFALVSGAVRTNLKNRYISIRTSKKKSAAYELAKYTLQGKQEQREAITPPNQEEKLASSVIFFFKPVRGDHPQSTK